MKITGKKTRLKILLIILGVVIIAFALVLYFYSPYSEAARGGSKRKATPAVTASPTAKPSASTSTSTPTAQVSIATLFSDNFSGTLSKWQIVYTSANIISGQLDLIPSSQTYSSSLDTHAPLVAAADSSWDSTKKDYTFSATMKTTRQLRPSNPNPWEVGWLLFRYVDAQHFYYFIHKTNGVELGKFTNGSQAFLATADNPKLTLNTNNNYKIVVKGNNIKISVNGTQVIDFTDNNSPYLTGKIGLYNEDSETVVDNVTVSAN